MLNNDKQEKLVDVLISRIEELNEDILIIIGQRIKSIGRMSQSQIHQINQMLIYGEDLQKIINKISEITKLNVQDIYKIFEKEAQINQNFAKQFYKAKGIEFIPYQQNKALKEQIKAMATITARQYTNLSKTKAIGYTIKDINGNIIFKDISTAYKETIDKAIISITQGKTTYQQEMKKVIKEIGRSGIKTIDYETGKSRRLDSAIRMNVLDGMRNLTNELQRQFGEEFDADGIEVSVHNNPAPDHAEIQGHQFSNKEYKKMQESKAFKDYKGYHYKAIDRHISEYNCYHYIFSIVLGISKPQYNEEQLKQIQEENQQGFELDGKHYTNYEGTQLQRALERKIREQKDVNILAKASDNAEAVLESQTNIIKLKNKYKQLSKISKLPMKKQRLTVSEYRR